MPGKLKRWYHQTYLRRIEKSLFERGLIPTLKLVYYENKFLWKYGIRSTGITNLENLSDIKSDLKEHGTRYESCNQFMFNKLISRLNINYKESRLVDFGSGKGLSLLYAAELGFKEVTGVEFSLQLVTQSKINFQKYEQKTGKKINHQLIHGDATRFEIPDDVNVFMFFNPFDGIVLDKVMQNIEASLQHNKRKIFVLYYNALHKEVIEKYNYKVEATVFKNELKLWETTGCYAFSK
jgi:SAM-dependent methyltransferase